MLSHISDLLPDMIYYQFNELIKEKETKLKKFKEAYKEYFEAEDKLREFMKNKKINKGIATAKISLEFALNLPSRMLMLLLLLLILKKMRRIIWMSLNM